MMGGICALADRARAQAQEEARAQGKSDKEIERAGKEAFDANFNDAANAALKVNGLMGKIVKLFTS